MILFVHNRNDTYTPFWQFYTPFSVHLWFLLAVSIIGITFIFVLLDRIVRNHPLKWMFSPLRSFWYFLYLVYSIYAHIHNRLVSAIYSPLDDKYTSLH